MEMIVWKMIFWCHHLNNAGGNSPWLICYNKNKSIPFWIDDVVKIQWPECFMSTRDSQDLPQVIPKFAPLQMRPNYVSLFLQLGHIIVILKARKWELSLFKCANKTLYVYRALIDARARDDVLFLRTNTSALISQRTINCEHIRLRSGLLFT